MILSVVLKQLAFCQTSGGSFIQVTVEQRKQRNGGHQTVMTVLAHVISVF